MAIEPKAPPLKSVKDGAPQVQNLNSEWTYGSSIRMWSGDDFVEYKRPGHPPFPLGAIGHLFVDVILGSINSSVPMVGQ
jgi:hypothetical protein